MSRKEFREFLRTLLNLLEEGNIEKAHEILDYHAYHPLICQVMIRRKR